jgi:hypothetical protein
MSIAIYKKEARILRLSGNYLDLFRLLPSNPNKDCIKKNKIVNLLFEILYFLNEKRSAIPDLIIYCRKLNRSKFQI